MSTSFHPETDGRSERTDKDWVRFLPSTEYAINTAVNDSTGKTPVELVLGYTPSLFPSPSSTDVSPTISAPAAEQVVEERRIKIQEARDSLAIAKVRQASAANRKRGKEPELKEGDLVMVDSADRRARYKAKAGDGRAAKLFPRWDGPYSIITSYPGTSTYRLSLPHNDRSHPVFHISKLKRYNPNDASTFSSREPPRPEPIDVDGNEEYMVESIVDERGTGRRRRFLVKWEGYPASDNSWVPLENVKDTEALVKWEERGEGGVWAPVRRLRGGGAGV
ncbi:hypothetical protein JCM11641_003508 [Rhodosporidiobolus odoratus]